MNDKRTIDRSSYPYKDDRGYTLVGEGYKSNGGLWYDFAFCTVGKYVAADNLPPEFRFALYPWMKLLPVEFSLYLDDMLKWKAWHERDPYGTIPYWKASGIMYRNGPQDGTESLSPVGYRFFRGESLSESAVEMYMQPYVTWLHSYAMGSATRATQRNEEIDYKAALSAEQSAERRAALEVEWATIHARNGVKTRMFSPSKNLTIVDTPKAQYAFSYETLVGVYVQDTEMFYISLADYNGESYGNTTRIHLNRFLSGKWQDLAKQGKLLVTTQAELDRMI